jgi:hypothetical protein
MAGLDPATHQINDYKARQRAMGGRLRGGHDILSLS